MPGLANCGAGPRRVSRLARRPFHTPAAGNQHADGAEPRAPGRRSRVKINRTELVRLLRTQGDNDTADRAEGTLPEEIDTEQDADALQSVGLDRARLQEKLAGGAFGGTLAP
jgi:hypothetical protein